MSEIHETTDGKIIPIENIDYVGEVERPYEWGYKVFMKSGSYLWVSKNDSRHYIVDCRNKLIDKLKNHKPCI